MNFFPSTLPKELFINSWWVVLFAFLCHLAYEEGVKTSHLSHALLSEQLAVLQMEKEKALSERSRLRREINSQDDPSWVGLTLMRELGLTPEGQTKVFFY